MLIVILDELWEKFNDWLVSNGTSFEKLKGETNESKITGWIRDSGVGLTNRFAESELLTMWKNKQQGI